MLQIQAAPATEGSTQVSSNGSSNNHPGPWLQIARAGAFEVNHLDVAVAGLPQALQHLRIVHITDLHLTGRWMPAHSRLVERLQAHPPDLILFTGDFVDHIFDHRPALPVLERFVSQLPSRLGKFAITGNHDGDLLGPHLGRLGVNYIDRRYVVLDSGDAAIELVGLPGVRRRNFDPGFIAGIPPRRAGVPRIVLSHFPDHVTLIQPLRADVMLAGHTHGGQVCLPNRRPLVTHDSLPKAMARGAHRVGSTLLVVNRGFGTTRWPIRVFCPAEVIELRLVRGEA